MGCSRSKPEVLEPLPGREFPVGGAGVPLLARVRAHAQAGIKKAVLESGLAAVEEAWTVSYAELREHAAEVSWSIAELLADVEVRHVAYLVGPGVGYVVVQLAVWGCGGVCVPLSAHSAPAELERLLLGSDCGLALADGPSEARLRPPAEKLGKRFASLAVRSGLEAGPRFVLSACPTAWFPASDVPRPGAEERARAMILFTAGATGKPRGVVHTHGSLAAQAELSAKAWRWTRDDHSLLVLPLHLLYGLQTSLYAALWSGAAVELARFSPAHCVQRLASGHITCFHAVPTMYAQLLQQLAAADAPGRAAFRAGAGSLRYAASGMAALPAPTARSWAEAAGQVLLEQYGTTETGVVLSNKVDGTRYPGCVGFQLPQLDVSLDDGHVLLVRGKALFDGYYKDDEATKKAFTRGSWFCTGDVVAVGGTEAELQGLRGSAEALAAAAGQRREQQGSLRRSRGKGDGLTGIYTLKGTSSWDTVQCGGYRISSQEVESVLTEHEAIQECAVLGKPDETWGERVMAVCTLRAGAHLDLDELRSWARTRLATYKLPAGLVVVDELPRNVDGKLEKCKLLNRLCEARPAPEGLCGVEEAEEPSTGEVGVGAGFFGCGGPHEGACGHPAGCAA